MQPAYYTSNGFMQEEPTPEKENNAENSANSPKINNALLGILGNALNSSLKHQKTGAGLETKRCPNCSAARPADTDLQYCAYCGHKFY